MDRTSSWWNSTTCTFLFSSLPFRYPASLHKTEWLDVLKQTVIFRILTWKENGSSSNPDHAFLLLFPRWSKVSCCDLMSWEIDCSPTRNNFYSIFLLASQEKAPIAFPGEKSFPSLFNNPFLVSYTSGNPRWSLPSFLYQCNKNFAIFPFQSWSGWLDPGSLINDPFRRERDLQKDWFKHLYWVSPINLCLEMIISGRTAKRHKDTQ